MENKLASANWGTLVIAINPKAFGKAADFHQSAQVMCARVKAARRLDPLQPILLPGERGDELEKANLESGYLSVRKSTYESLLAFTKPGVTWDDTHGNH